MIENSKYFHLFKDSEFDGTYVKEIDTSKMTRQQWLAVRRSFNAIGGSDVGTIMNLNPYKSAIRLFYEKMGVVESDFKENNFTFWGQVLEDPVIKVWKHWDGDHESMYNNYWSNIRIRDGRPRGMIWNPKFPYVIANIDHEITLHPEYESHGVYEGKTISGFAQDKWQSGLPVYYIPQPYSYCIVTESQYAEFAVLRDGRDFSVHTFDAKHNIINTIRTAIEEFAWRMKEGFEIVRKVKKRNEQLQELGQVEPEPPIEAEDGSAEDYGKFMSQRHIELGDKVIRDASPDEILIAEEYRKTADAFRVKKIEELNLKNQLKKMMSDSMTRKIEYRIDGEKHYVTFNKKFVYG